MRMLVTWICAMLVAIAITEVAVYAMDLSVFGSFAIGALVGLACVVGFTEWVERH